MPTKISAGAKLPPLTKNPITRGTTTEERLPMKLNTPPVRPIKGLGAKAETKIHEMAAKPFPKKAMVIKRMISAVLST